MHALLIENPTAHKVNPAHRRVIERALEATFDLELVATESRGHAAELARESAEAGSKAVIVYGGDGTVNEVVNGLAGASGGTDVILGVLPGGGTNVLARTLGYPNDLVDATGHLIDLVERGRVSRINIARLHAWGPGNEQDRLFTFGAGLGLDAETVRRVEASGLRPRLGDLAFVYYCMRAFLHLRTADEPALVIDSPDGPIDAWWAMFCVSDPLTYFGRRPLRVAPNARNDRGLDVTAGRTAGFWRTLRWARQALGSAKHVRDPRCEYLEDVEAVEVSATRAVPLQADGEYLGLVTAMRVESLPRALPVWT